jgi:hypothetical protein
MTTADTIVAGTEDRRERLLRVLAAATFLIFFQAYMVAPLMRASSSPSSS